MRLLATLSVVLVLATTAPTALAGGIFFEAFLDGSQVVPPTGSQNSGYAFMELTDTGNGPELSYHISLFGLDLDGQQTPNDPADDVTAIHIHFGAIGEEGGHALNIFGLPREDDADMTFDAGFGTVMGIWDNSDENLAPPPSFALSDSLDALFAEGLYFQVHTNAFPDGEIRGQIVAVPAPGVLAVFTLAAICPKRRRRQ